MRGRSRLLASQRYVCEMSSELALWCTYASALCMMNFVDQCSVGSLHASNHIHMPMSSGNIWIVRHHKSCHCTMCTVTCKRCIKSNCAANYVPIKLSHIVAHGTAMSRPMKLSASIEHPLSESAYIVTQCVSYRDTSTHALHAYSMQQACRGASYEKMNLWQMSKHFTHNHMVVKLWQP